MRLLALMLMATATYAQNMLAPMILETASGAPSVAVAFDATNSNAASGAYVDVTLTIAANSNRYVHVQAWSYYATIDSVANITDGVTLTQACYRDANNFESGIWYQAAPASGNKTFRVYRTGSGMIGGSATSYYNVNESTPLRGTSQTGAGTSTDPSYSSFATATTDLVFCSLLVNVNAGNWTVTGDGTSRYDYNESVAGDLEVAGNDNTPTGSTITYSWALQSSVEWVLNIVSIRRAVE